MASLYTIQEELLKLFGEVEANDGEITEEQLDILNIKEEELKDKLESYHKAIQSWKADMAACKEEEKRIYNTRKKYENRIERLKNIMLETVNTFGADGKNNKFIELPTARIYTKSSKSVEVDEERTALLINAMICFITEAYNNDCLYTGNDVDFAGILQAVNANVIAEQGSNFKPYTIEDLAILSVDVTYNGSFMTMFTGKEKVLELIASLYINTIVKQNTPKEAFKYTIEVNGPDKITIAKIVENQSLQIK